MRSSFMLDASGEIYGDVANISARVQALAEPGAVLVTAQVQRQIAGLFVAQERGAHTLKGVPEPLRLFRSGQRNLTPLAAKAASSSSAEWIIIGSSARVAAADARGSAISLRSWAGTRKSPC